MRDPSSRPHRSPSRTDPVLEATIVAMRRDRRLGPARIAGIVGLPALTVHRVLVCHGMPRLAWLDRPSGEPVRRYERARPGELLHVDVKKIGRLRDGGGWRVHGRDSLERCRAREGVRAGYEYVHCAIDDHTRLAYAEIDPDERAQTCAGFLRRAAAWVAAHGIAQIERVMTDDAMAYRRSAAWRDALADIGADATFTRRYRPQTNRKAERFNRTSARGVGLRPPVRLRRRSRRSLADLAALLQPSPHTHCARRRLTHRPRQERHEALHLGGAGLLHAAEPHGEPTYALDEDGRWQHVSG